MHANKREWKETQAFTWLVFLFVLCFLPGLAAARDYRFEGSMSEEVPLVPQSVLKEYKRLCCGQECPAYEWGS